MNAPRRKIRFDDWDAVIADVEVLGANGYEHASYGKLSLGQIASHLAKVLDGGVDGFEKIAAWPMRMMLRLFVLKSMLRHVPTNMKIPAPPSLAPPEQCDDDEGIEKLRVAIARFRSHEGEYQPHIAFGNLTRDQWTHQQFWHCEHHLSFLLPKESAGS
ncbi:MAG: hypothetical protein ACI9HK_005371 [Pirellulaceae bacterium]|jgi:hypothetical protein